MDPIIEQLEQSLKDGAVELGEEGKALVRESASATSEGVKLLAQGNAASYVYSHTKARLAQLVAIHMANAEQAAKDRVNAIFNTFLRGAIAIAAAAV